MENLKELLSGFNKDAYISSLIVVAKSDGIVTKEEREFIEFQSTFLGVETENLWKTSSTISDLEFSNLTKSTKLIILRDIISLGYIDGLFDDNERKDMLQIANKLEIDESEVFSLESWLKEYWAVLEKGKKLIGVE